MKENDLAHGKWEKWLNSVDIVQRAARVFIQIYEQFGKSESSPNWGLIKYLKCSPA
ncbi:DUF3102 domain-containing protein [Paenibacillus polymyxa]|uniref:DUF3102 domain-containing protein n=1 Tax=Paenibacillus polymyxa TaxID=1406 RepID=UPI000AC3911B|nr:DUF3102 domain-containing protein [Paenibacillus polymyxa]